MHYSPNMQRHEQDILERVSTLVPYVPTLIGVSHEGNALVMSSVATPFCSPHTKNNSAVDLRRLK